MPTDSQWALAFAAQSRADLEVRDLLSANNAPAFARLHFLQMAAEKLCKSFQVRDSGVEHLQFSHCLIRKLMPQILTDVLRRTQAWPPDRIRTYLRQLGPLLAEVELLCPACDEQRNRPDNTEYPWFDPTGKVVAPANFSFPNLNDRDRRVTQFTKLMRQALDSLEHSINAVNF